MKTPWLLTVLITIGIGSCQPPADKDKTALRKIIDIPKATRVIKILPLGKTRNGQIIMVEAQLKKVFPEVAVLPARQMPRHARSSYRPRWRADSLLVWLSKQVPDNEVWIAVTMEDISHTKGKNQDYGIMGLGHRPGKACIVSDARLKTHREEGFPKIVLHELGHTTGLDHCPDKSCTMQDAEGKNVTPQMKGFCKSCLETLQSKGWQL